MTEREDIHRRWKKYFETVLTGNRGDAGDADSTTFFTAENEDIQPSYEKVAHVIGRFQPFTGHEDP